MRDNPDYEAMYEEAMRLSKVFYAFDAERARRFQEYNDMIQRRARSIWWAGFKRRIKAVFA